MKELLYKMISYASHVFAFLLYKASTTRIRCFSSKINFTHYSKTHSLNDQQQAILEAIAQKKSVFVTGSAGTGKSLVVSLAIQLLRNEIYRPDEVFITASTGVAACALNGQTLHSFSGVGLGVGDKYVLLSRVYKNRKALMRWQQVKALIIDEVSMIKCDLFENLEYIARKVRLHNDKPWGGIQLIVSGDFFQLPPIVNETYGRVFAFEADCWKTSFNLQIELTQIFRQSDTELIDLLQGIRRGRKDEHHLQILNNCYDEPGEFSDNVPWIYPRNMEVNKVNENMLGMLDGEIVKYTAYDTGKQPWKSQLKQGIAPDELEIRKGARVMLVKNMDLDNGLVNGATGTVVDFVKPIQRLPGSICAEGLVPMVRFDSGLVKVIHPETWEMMEGEKRLAARKQIPLILAWAVSVHKCQGMTLDCLYTDLSKAFGYGMVYVALSRVRSLKGLHLSGFDSSKIKAHPKVLQFYKNELGS